MKIYVIFTVLFLNVVLLHGQNKQESNPESQVTIEHDKTECIEARNHAIEDFKKGIRKVYTFGIVDDIKYRQVLTEKYKIDAHHVGCVVSDKLKCYSDCMEELIAQERGFGFFEKVRLETGTKSLPIKSTMIKSTF